MKLLFLGASRLVSLLERFQLAAIGLGTRVEIFTFENDQPWHAVGAARIAQVISAPPFLSEDFPDFIAAFVEARQIDIVIPAIDRATIALSRASGALTALGATVICSSQCVCEHMADKQLADKVFRSLGLPVPGSTSYPLLAKPRHGASSRGLVRLADEAERHFWAHRSDEGEFLIQEFIQGTEYSIDAFVDGSGRTLGIVSRTRDVVADGEVMVSRTAHLPQAKEITTSLLAWDHWRGPITVQVMDDGERVWLLECNPRFGSGVTLSIEAGLDIPKWILQERLGLPLPHSKIEWQEGLCMTRYRKDAFLWLS